MKISAFWNSISMQLLSLLSQRFYHGRSRCNLTLYLDLHEYMLAWLLLRSATIHLDRRTRDEEPLVKLAFNWCRSEVLVRLHPDGARFHTIRRIWDSQIGQ